MAAFEFWLTDDAGKRLELLDRFAFASYSRVVSGRSTLQIGIPYRDFEKRIKPVFAPDRRIDVWRSPAHGYPLRREGVFLLRKPKIYTRTEDALQIIEFFGRGPVDLLNRRFVVQQPGTTYSEKTAAIDDMMKEIVREQMLFGYAVDHNGLFDNSRAYPADEFSVQFDVARGPVVSKRFAGRNVLDVLKDLKDLSFQKHEDNPLFNERIYFDVVPLELGGFEIFILDEPTGAIILDERGEGLEDEQSITSRAELGLQFQTFVNLRGQDRTSLFEFSVENGNMIKPFYAVDHFDEVNAVIVRGQGRGESQATAVVEDVVRIGASRWNRCEDMASASYEAEETALEEVGRGELTVGRPREELYVTFLNTPGGLHQPRSLYGVDWDLGDLVRVTYAGIQMEAEIVIVYVSYDENGEEEITGRNDVGEIG